MTTTDRPTSNTSILANLEKLREASKASAESSAPPAFIPKSVAPPRHSTYRKGGLLDQANEASLSENAKELTEFIGGVQGLEAVKQWGKPQRDFKQVGPQSVLIRCPKPEHPDNNPSASFDLVEMVYRCHACAEGGDIYTMAAIHHGMDPRTYQNGHSFVELKEKMALDLGATVHESAGVKFVIPPGGSEPKPKPVKLPDNPAIGSPVQAPQPVEFAPAPVQQPVQTPQFTGGVFGNAPIDQPPPPPIPQPVTFDDEPVIRAKPKLDWIPLGKNRSFIDTYMKCIERDEYPDEFAFASALICLSFVAGRHIKLDGMRKIVSPLGIVTVAGTGVGKTRALNDAIEVLAEVMPWRGAELAIGTGGQVVPGTGVKSVRGVGSGENLIRQFEDIVKVQNGTAADGTPLWEEHENPVNGLISFNELSQFVGKASITGSTLRERMFDFIEFPPEVASRTNTAGNYRAVRPYACMYSSIQPSMIHKILSESDEHSGQLNRFLFFTGEAKERDHKDMTPIDLSPAVKALREVKDFWEAQGECTVTYDDHSLAEMDKYCKTTLIPLEQSGNGMLGRLRLTFWRLTLLICMNEMSRVVTMDIFEKAKKLLDYLISTYHYVSGELYDPSGLHEFNDIENLIVQRVKKLQEEAIEKGAEDLFAAAVPATSIRRGVDRQIKKLSSSPTQFFNRTLDAMCELGTLGRVSTSSGAKYYVP